jgi:protein Hikeshi
MFAIIVSGRPVLSIFTTISSTQVAFQIPSSPSFNHLVVFLLPDTVLPPDQAAAVYIQLSPNAEFLLLGALSADKPSAIFRVRNVGAVSAAFGETADEDAMEDDGAAPAGGANITLGISVEPTAQVEQALAAMKAASATSKTGLELVKHTPAMGPTVPTKVLASRIIANAFNFLASFGSETIPLRAFQEWWRKFERRVAADPTFLERGDGV